MGRIIRFPIKVKTDFANESIYGVTPVLNSEVRPLSAVTTTALPSELAMRKALDSLTISFSGNNVGVICRELRNFIN
jgi:hypothetical protein